MATITSSASLQSIAPDRFFESPSNEAGIVQNLAWHNLLVLDREFQEQGNYPKARPTLILPADAGKRSDKDRAHYEALQSAVKAIIPDITRLRLVLPTSAVDAFDFSQLFRSAISDILRKTDERSMAIRQEVRSILEEALTHWPRAFCWYCNEIAAIDSDRVALLARLGSTIAHTATVEDVRMVEHSFANLAGLQREGLQPSPMTAKEDNRGNGSGSSAVRGFTPEANETNAPASSTVLTRRQRAVVDHVVELGELFFRYRKQPCAKLQPRLFPLLCGPTGCGKSMLVAEAASRLRAFNKRSQIGDLAPQGASRVRSSLFQVLDSLAQHERVVWHIDELDKFVGGGAAPIAPTDWGSSIYSDLWSGLDGAFPLETYLATEDRPTAKDPAVTLGFLRERVRTGLYVVGSGTWQMAFVNASKPKIGFADSHKSVGEEVTVSDILRSRQISPELLGRFNANLLILTYPDAAEIQEILDLTGIRSLARQCGYTITAEDLEFSRGGFRVLEALMSRLLLIQHRQTMGRNPPACSPPISSSEGAPLT